MKKIWEPEMTLIPHNVESKELKLNIEEMAGFIYDLFCQLQKKKSNLDLSKNTEFNQTLGKGLDHE